MHKLVQLSQRLREDFSELLEKAVKSDDWNRIIRGHKPEGEEIVDVDPYLSEHVQAHPHYKEMLNDPKEYKAKGAREIVGASPKIVHGSVREDIPNVSAGFGTYMTKPFHAGASSGSKHHGENKHFGWATMAAHGLFHAAGMGNQVEDVSVHQHQGIPVTIHRFQPGVKEWENPAGGWVSDEVKHQYKDPDTLHDVGRGAVLDFLMGNTDRHGGNIMQTQDIQTNKIKPFYLDHERTFQYKNLLATAVPHLRQEGPQTDTIAQHAVRQVGGGLSGSVDENRIREWWDDKKHAIKDEFYRHLKNIKDKNIKSHIEKNFNQRMEHVDQYLGNGVFPSWSGADPGVDIIKPARKPKVTTNQILQNLPRDPLEALRVLDKAMVGKSRAVKDKLKSAQHQLVPLLAPQHLIPAYQEFQRKESGVNGIPYDILSHLYHNGKLSGMKQMLDFHRGEMVKQGLDSEGAVYHHGVGLPPYWHERFMEKLKGEK